MRVDRDGSSLRCRSFLDQFASYPPLAGMRAFTGVPSAFGFAAQPAQAMMIVSSALWMMALIMGRLRMMGSPAFGVQERIPAFMPRRTSVPWPALICSVAERDFSMASVLSRSVTAETSRSPPCTSGPVRSCRAEREAPAEAVAGPAIAPNTVSFRAVTSRSRQPEGSMQTDRYGLQISTASREAADAFISAYDLFFALLPGSAEAFDAAAAHDPNFALAHLAHLMRGHSR